MIVMQQAVLNGHAKIQSLYQEVACTKAEQIEKLSALAYLIGDGQQHDKGHCRDGNDNREEVYQYRTEYKHISILPYFQDKSG